VVEGEVVPWSVEIVGEEVYEIQPFPDLGYFVGFIDDAVGGGYC